MARKNKKKDTIGGLLFVGCLFLGMGIGFLSGEIVAGVLLGLGGGFISQALWYVYKKKK